MDINHHISDNISYSTYKSDIPNKSIKNNYSPVQGIHCPTLLNKAFFHNIYSAPFIR